MTRAVILFFATWAASVVAVFTITLLAVLAGQF